jgi:macrolide transport system ATP-binding/permease protein
MDTVLFRSLPVHNPAQLRFIRKAGGRCPASHFSLPYYVQMRNHRELADDMLAFFDAGGALQVSIDASGSHAQPEVVHAQLVSGNYFSVLGVRPIVGRALPVEADSAQHSEALAVISYSYWHRRFRGAPTAVGAKILINGNPFTVIGVTPPEFAGLTPGAPPDVTAPLTLQPLIWLEPGTSILSNARFGWLRLMLRLRAEVQEQAVRAGLSVISRQVDESLGVRPAAQRPNDVGHIELLPGERGLDALRLRFSKPLLVLMALVGFVLLAACANIAVLLLARARQHEIGTRLALGATSGRLMRQLLAESSVIAVAGSILGLLFAYAGSELLLKFLADSPIPIRLTFSIDGRLLAFVAALTVITALICGLFPAMQAIKLAIASSFWRGGRAGENSRPGHARFSRWKVLVVFQIALSLVLLVAAGLFIGTLKNLQGVDAGFDPHDLLLVTVDPSLAGYHEPLLSNAYGELLSRMRQIPGVASVTMTSHSLVSPGIDDAGFTVPGRTPKPGEPRGVNLDLVASDFFETMRVPVVLGRGIMRQDGDTNYRVAVITESIAKQYFSGENSIGKHASIGGPPIEIVGVTQDIKFNSLHDEGSRVVYVPYLQRPTWHPTPSQMTFALRTVEPHSDALASTVRQLIARYDRYLPITSIKPAEQQITESLVQERLLASLSVGFGVLGLTLAVSESRARWLTLQPAEGTKSEYEWPLARKEAM